MRVLFFCFAFLIFSFNFAAAQTNETFTFVVFGDNQGWDNIFNDVIKKINQEPKLDFIVSVGDMVPNGKESDYKHFIKQKNRLKAKFYPTPGNHDMMRHGYLHYKKYFGPYYYSFDYQNSHFIILNNAFAESFHLKQFNWLKKDLKKNKKKNIFVFMHRPTFDPTEIYKNYIMSGRQVTKELMALFKKYKVKYVFAGHIHGYAKDKRDGINYVVTGGAGGKLYLPRNFGGFHHYVRITVDGEKIKDEVVWIYE